MPVYKPGCNEWYLPGDRIATLMLYVSYLHLSWILKNKRAVGARLYHNLNTVYYIVYITRIRKTLHSFVFLHHLLRSFNSLSSQPSTTLLLIKLPPSPSSPTWVLGVGRGSQGQVCLWLLRLGRPSFGTTSSATGRPIGTPCTVDVPCWWEASGVSTRLHDWCVWGPTCLHSGEADVCQGWVWGGVGYNRRDEWRGTGVGTGGYRWFEVHVLDTYTRGYDGAPHIQELSHRISFDLISGSRNIWWVSC